MVNNTVPSTEYLCIIEAVLWFYCISLGDLAFHSACGAPSELQTTVTVAHTV